jgi:hypothetical protein
VRNRRPTPTATFVIKRSTLSIFRRKAISLANQRFGRNSSISLGYRKLVVAYRLLLF